MEPQQPNQPQSSRTLELVIRDRSSVLLDSPIKSLSSTNDKGPFDILAEHANFITIVKTKLTVRLLDGKVQEIPIDQGVLKVNGNKIVIFLGIKT